jgi:hypothetical protein
MKDYIITDPAELNAISALPLKRTSGLGRIRLGGTLSEHPDRERWEKELNKGYFACGCDTGAKGLLIGLVVGLIWAGYSYANGDASLWGLATKAVGLALAGAVAGKLYGLLKAESRLRKTASEIQQNWPVKRGEPNMILCG